MDAVLPIVSFGAGIVGVVLGAALTRRNDKKAVSERLLVEAINDALAAIAKVAGSNGQDSKAMNAYASPAVVAAFRAFQDDPTTATLNGRHRLLVALNQARQELGQVTVDEQDLAVLLFGPGGPKPDEPAPANVSSSR